MLHAVRVLIADDEPFIAYDLATAVEDAHGEVIGPCGSLREAFTLLESLEPPADPRGGAHQPAVLDERSVHGALLLSLSRRGGAAIEVHPAKQIVGVMIAADDLDHHATAEGSADGEVALESLGSVEALATGEKGEAGPLARRDRRIRQCRP